LSSFIVDICPDL